MKKTIVPVVHTCEYCGQNFPKVQGRSAHKRYSHRGWPARPTVADVERFKSANQPAVLTIEAPPMSPVITNGALAIEVVAPPQPLRGGVIDRLRDELEANNSQQQNLLAEMRRLRELEVELSALGRERDFLQTAIAELEKSWLAAEQQLAETRPKAN